MAGCKVGLNERIIQQAKHFEKIGIKPIDALHLAIADLERITYFCTCDDRFFKRAKTIPQLQTRIVVMTVPM